MTWADHVTSMGGVRDTYKILVRKPDRKRPLGGPRHTWTHSITVDLRM